MTFSSALGPAERDVRCVWRNPFEGTDSPGVGGGDAVACLEEEDSEDKDTAVPELAVDPCKVGSEIEAVAITSLLETSMTTDG